MGALSYPLLPGISADLYVTFKPILRPHRNISNRRLCASYKLFILRYVRISQLDRVPTYILHIRGLR